MMKRCYIALLSVLIFASCTKEGNTIYQPDPDEPKASTAPLVTVIYGKDALGDRSYNDLLYVGVEEAAAKYGLRTMQLSPISDEEGLGYLQSMFETVKSQADTIRRLFIVTTSAYDEILRQNSSVFDSNPYADLLYLETSEPLASGGSTLYLPYYGAMYEAGALMLSLHHNKCLLLVANTADETVNMGAKGFADGFLTDYYEAKYDWGDVLEKHLETRYLAMRAGEGYNIADSSVFQLLNELSEAYFYGYIIPLCGGSGTKIRYFSDIAFNIGDFMGVDVLSPTGLISALKHIDRAVGLCIGQWLSPEGMPKHQVLGLKEGYTEVVLDLGEVYSELYHKYITEELHQQIHEDAIRKEEAYEK